MMRLYGALMLLTILSTACGLTCYTCVSNNPISCLRKTTCPETLDRCFSVNVTGYITKGCRREANCMKPVSCCDEDLCNSAILPTGPGGALLLVASATVARSMRIWN